MATSWKFRPGDVVRHKDYEDLIGVIYQCKLGREVDVDMGDNEPWYLITWVRPHHEVGQEHESQLVPVFRPVLPLGHPHGPSSPNGFKL